METSGPILLTVTGSFLHTYIYIHSYLHRSIYSLIFRQDWVITPHLNVLFFWNSIKFHNNNNKKKDNVWKNSSLVHINVTFW